MDHNSTSYLHNRKEKINIESYSLCFHNSVSKKNLYLILSNYFFWKGDVLRKYW